MVNYSILRRSALGKVSFRFLLFVLFALLLINFAKAESFNEKEFELITLKNDFKKLGFYDGSYFSALKGEGNERTFHFISADGRVINFADGNIVNYSFKPVLSYYKLSKSVKVGNDSSYREFYVNAKGEYLFNATFNKIALSEYGYALVQVREGDNVYLLDMSGRVLRKYPPMYDFQFINNPNYFVRRYHITEGSTQYYHESLVDIDGNESFKNNDFSSIRNVSGDSIVMTRKKGTESHIFVDPLFFTLDEKPVYSKTNKAGIFIYEPFKKGLAIAKKGKQVGIIRPDETFAITLGKYDTIKRTHNDRFIASRKAYYDLLDSNAKVMKSFEKAKFGELRSYTDTAYIFDKGGRFYYFDKNLNKISDTGYKRAYNFKNGCAMAINEDKIFILKDKSYKAKREVIPSKLIKPDKTLKEKTASDIINPVFYVGKKVYTLKDLSPIYLDKRYKFESMFNNDGLFVFEDKTDNKKVIIDYKGRVISSKKYIDIPKVDEISSSFINSLRVEDKVVLDDMAKAKVSNGYSDLVYYEDKQVYQAQKKVGTRYKYGLLNNNAKPITDFEYDDILGYKDGKFVFRKGMKVGLIDYRARKILDFKYEDIKIADDDHFGVKLGSNYYLINKSGKKISNDKYTYMGDFNRNNLCIVGYRGKESIINAKGEVVFSPERFVTNIVSLDDFNNVGLKFEDKYKEVKIKSVKNKFGYDSYFKSRHSNVMIVSKNGKKGLTDGNFKEILPPVYDKIDDFSNGVFDLYTHGSRKSHSIYNPYLKKIFKYNKYDIRSMFGTDDYVIIEDSSTGLIGVADEKKIIIEPKYKRIRYVASKFYARNEELEENAKHIYVYDKSGNYLGEKKYNAAYEYSEGVGYINNSFVDEEGRVIVKDNFSSVTPFIKGYMLAITGSHDDIQYILISLDKVKELGGVK